MLTKPTWAPGEAISSDKLDAMSDYAEAVAAVAAASVTPTPPPSRASASVTTGALNSGDSDAVRTLTLSKSTLMLKLATNRATWVRVYPDAASRDADAARAITDDPASGVNVALEVVTTSDRLSVTLAPGVVATNDTGTFYLRITNLGASGTVTVTVTSLLLEA